MDPCSGAALGLFAIAKVCVTEGLVKAIFAVICFLSAGVGAFLTISAGDALAAAMPPEFPEWPTSLANSTYDYTIERGERFEALRVSAMTSRIGVAVLFLSVSTGLIINFPGVALASLGLAATLASLAYGVPYGLKIPDLRWRMNLWKRHQHLRNITQGNVVGQNAVVELRSYLTAPRREARSVENELKRLIALEESRIEERSRHQQQSTTPGTNPQTPDAPPSPSGSDESPEPYARE